MQVASEMRLVSVNFGLPREVLWKRRIVSTSIFKDPVAGRVAVHRLNLEGDRQADLTVHGGEHRAVFVYQIESYHYWERQLNRNDFVYGQFGENFTVEGLSDEEVCIGVNAEEVKEMFRFSGVNGERKGSRHFL